MERAFFFIFGFLSAFALAWTFYNLGRTSIKEKRFGEDYWNGYRDGRDVTIKYLDKILKKLEAIEEKNNA